MKVKKSALLTKLRKDPNALRQLFDFVRKTSGQSGKQDQISVADKTYTLRRSPSINVSPY